MSIRGADDDFAIILYLFVQFIQTYLNSFQ